MKKIIIFYASYGGGHLSAAKSIEEQIHKSYPNIETELIDCMKYINKTIEKVTTSAYKEMAKKFPWAWGRVYSNSQKGPLAHISSRANQIMAVKLLKLLRQENADLIISTHPFGSQMCSYLKRKGKITSRIATIMTDFAPHDQWLVGEDFTDYFFVSNEGMKEAIVEKGVSANKIYVTGIPISSRFLQTYSKEEILKEFELAPNKKTILFFGGGEFGLGKSKTLEILNILAENFNNIQIVAISGRNESMKKHFEEIVAQKNKANSIKILEFTNKVPELMSISDFVITKPGGLTVSESLASGLPIVIINPIPGQEEENAEFLENKGVAIWLKKETDSKKEIEQLINVSEKLEEMKKQVNLLAKKNSTEDIVAILLK